MVLNRSVEQKESPEISPCNHSQPIFDKREKKVSFNKWWWNKWTSTYTEKMTLDTDFIPFIKINSKWIVDLNIKCKTKTSRR